ncbi:helix-turn-helix domain-containing protein [Flavobacterium poyangense]|uniref:helix-turn-helix domain-containing protein n=1 Tax=Flavobacterium poyangense TaxID=2204302 RepID=UPI00142102B9|nr:helix-turn-helix transcriptional regulator [Flavobacterium sp. JXAS1]
MDTVEKTKHIGQKISRIRKLKDIKKKALAQALGTNLEVISAIEKEKTIEESKLVEIAKALGVSVEAIKYVTKKKAIKHDITFDEAVEIALIMVAVLGIFVFAVLIL